MHMMVVAARRHKSEMLAADHASVKREQWQAKGGDCNNQSL
jgi:hypothetical protein